MNEILFELISSWPGLLGRPDRALVEDSLALLEFIPPGPQRLVDVGSGGGLPGLPLKLARSELSLTLVEANHKKAAFLNQAVAQLVLRDVEVVAERAETVGRDPRHREAYDVAVARAVAAMPVLAELCLPLVRVGGRLLAMKTDPAEVAGAEPVIRRLGGKLIEVAAAPTAARSSGRVVVVTKVATTPDEFPRRPGMPGRKPLAG